MPTVSTNVKTPIEDFLAAILSEALSVPTFVLIRSYIPPYSSASYKFRRHLNKIDYEQFNNELYDILQNKLSHNSINIHQKFDTLVGTFKNLLDKHAPLIRQSRRERKLAQKPWITKAIMVSIRHKNRLFSKICKNRTPSATNAYKKYRNVLNG